jgi:Putative sensor
MRSLLGWDAPAPSYVAPSGSRVRRILTPLRDPQCWLDVVWGVVGLVTGTIAFVLALTWWAGALGGLSYWFWERFVPQGDDVTLASLVGLGDGRGADIALTSVIGAVAALTLPLVVRFASVLDGSVARVLLCSRASLQDPRG